MIQDFENIDKRRKLERSFSAKFFPMEAKAFKNRNKFFCLFIIIKCCFECRNAGR